MAATLGEITCARCARSHWRAEIEAWECAPQIAEVERLQREHEEARAEVERLRAEVATLTRERDEARLAAEQAEALTHAQVRAGYDRGIADLWRAALEKMTAERDEARAILIEAVNPDTPGDGPSEVRPDIGLIPLARRAASLIRSGRAERDGLRKQIREAWEEVRRTVFRFDLPHEEHLSEAIDGLSCEIENLRAANARLDRKIATMTIADPEVNP